MHLEIYAYKIHVYRLAQKLFRTFHQCAHNNLVYFLLKKHNSEDLMETWSVIMIANFYQDCSLYQSLLNGNVFQLFQVHHFYLGSYLGFYF